MKVYRVASTQLEFDLTCSPDKTWNLEHSGFILAPETMHTYPVDILHEAAGRGCYRSWDRPNPETATNETYLRNSILSHQHYSVVEHGSMTLWLTAISRNQLGELVRHRHLSYSFLSTRYVDYSEEAVVAPPIADSLPENVRERFMRDLATASWFTRESYKFWYNEFKELGFKKKEARTGAREFLLGSMATEGFVSGNVRAWREFVIKRGNEGAAEDMRLLAQEVLQNLREICPHSVQDLNDIVV